MSIRGSKLSTVIKDKKIEAIYLHALKLIPFYVLIIEAK